MESRPTWITTVSELLAIFRESLVALVPVLEKARVRWRDGEAYDDWDAITSCLYENIVVASLSWAIEVGREINLLGREVKLPDYHLLYPSYQEMDLILVRSDELPEDMVAAFNKFAGTSPDFSVVECVELIMPERIPSPSLRYVLYDRAHFYYAPKGDISQLVDALTVYL
jgi:hypothetical protein